MGTATFASGTATAVTGSNTAQALTTATEKADTTNLALVKGANTLTIVHSVDGSYVVTITVNGIVSALVVKDQADTALTLSPTFASGVLTGYTATAATTATSLKVTATFGSGTATAVTGSNTAQALTTATEIEDTTNLALTSGTNTLTIAHSE